jgi:hypothetical protein
MTRRLFLGGILGALTASATGLLSLLSEPAEEAPGGGNALLNEDDVPLLNEDDEALLNEE